MCSTSCQGPSQRVFVSCAACMHICWLTQYYIMFDACSVHHSSPWLTFSTQLCLTSIWACFCTHASLGHVQPCCIISLHCCASAWRYVQGAEYQVKSNQCQRSQHLLPYHPDLMDPGMLNLQIPALSGFSKLRRLEFSYNEVR